MAIYFIDSLLYKVSISPSIEDVYISIASGDIYSSFFINAIDAISVTCALETFAIAFDFNAISFASSIYAIVVPALQFLALSMTLQMPFDFDAIVSAFP